MTPQSLFRSIVALSLVLSIICAVSGQFPGSIPDDWKTVLEWNGNGGLIEYATNNIPADNFARIGLLLLLLACLVLVVAAQIGMFLFWRFARTGYVVLTGAFILLTAFDGLVVTVPVQESLYELTLVVDGMVIAISYLNPIGAYFEGRNV